MATSRTIALAVGTLVVGLAAGWLAGTAGREASREEATPRVASESLPRTEDAPAAAEAQRAPRASRSHFATTTSPAPPSTAATATGRISGHVRDAQGRGVVGVLVRATPVRERDEVPPSEPGRARGAPPPDLDEEIEQAAERIRREHAARPQATTDAAGAFELTGLAERRYTVEAWLTGFRVERVEPPRPVLPGATCDFRALPTSIVRFALLLPDGRPPARATIFCRAVDVRVAIGEPWTVETAERDLPAGAYEVQAHAGPKDVFEGGPQTFTVKEGEPLEVTLRLAGQPGIHGTLTFRGPEHPRHVRVACVRLEGNDADPRALLAARKGQWLGEKVRWLGREEPAGEFAFADLEPGRYLVGVTFRGGRIGPSTVVTVDSSLVACDLAVDEADLRDFVKVWVVSPEGEKLRDVDVWTGCRAEVGEGEAQVVDADQPEGWFRVEHFELGAPNEGGGSASGDVLTGKRQYWLRATSHRYGTQEVPYDPAADAEVTIRFDAPARLIATLEGYAHHPDRARLVPDLEPPRDRTRLDFGEPEAGFDASGTVTFRPVKPGPYEFVVTIREPFDRDDPFQRLHARFGGKPLLRVPVTLRSGDNAVTFQIPTLAQLVVHRDAAYAKTLLSLWRIDAEDRLRYVAASDESDEAADVTFEGLAPGRYLLNGKRVGAMWVELPAQTRVTFRPRPHNAWRVEDPAGYLTELTLRTGDLVVAVDGVEFDSRLQMEAQVAAARTREGVKLTVLRGTQRFEVAADARRLEVENQSVLMPWAR